MTTEQAAKAMKVRTRRIRQFIEVGRLPGAYKAGRDWLIPESAVTSFKPEKRGPKGPRKGTP